MMSRDVDAFQAVSPDNIRTRMKSHAIQSSKEFPESTYPHIRRSSVLVPLFFQNGDLHLLLTVRAASLRHHASMVSFPGGRKDDADVDDVATALRESEEEIGLPPSQVEPIGCLVPTCARPHYSIFPVVALIPDDFRPEPNEQEVAFVFSVPLARFLRTDVVKKEMQLFGRTATYYIFPCATERGTVQVWGATAALCVMVASIVYQQEPVVSSAFGDSGSLDKFVQDLRDFYVYFYYAQVSLQKEDPCDACVSEMSTAVTLCGDITPDDLRARISKYNIRATKEFPDSAYPHIHRSSVLFPIFFKDGEVHVLLTVRSPTLRHEALMVTFPGGRKDTSDVDDAATALRESEEEIGLSSSQVEILGTLVPVFSRPHFSVFPVIGLIPDNFLPEPNEEVSHVFSVPLLRFLQDDYWTHDITLFGRTMTLAFYPYETENGKVTVWGTTSLLCVLVAAIVYQRDVPVNVVGDGGPCDHVVEEFRKYFIFMCESTKPSPKV